MKREGNWDFVKLLLMFFIVYGHICPANPEEWTPVTRIIGLFAIPLFFFISGYFQSKVDSFKALIDRYKKNFFRIVVPMLSWGLIYVFFSSIKLFDGISYNFVDVWSFYKYTPFYIMGFYWFLTALIFCQIIGSVLSLIINSNIKIGILLLLASFPFFCLLPPNFIEHYHFSFIWFFYGVGMLYRQLGKDWLTHEYSVIIQLSMSIMTIILLFGIGIHFMPSDTFYYKSNLVANTLYSFVIQRYALYFIVSLLMLFWMHQCYKRFKDKVIIQTLASWGLDTLFIYCSHMLFLEFIYKPCMLPFLFHEDGTILERLMEHLVGFVLSLVLYYLLQSVCIYSKRFKWVRMLLMGMQ